MLTKDKVYFNQEESASKLITKEDTSRTTSTILLLKKIGMDSAKDNSLDSLKAKLTDMDIVIDPAFW